MSVYFLFNSMWKDRQRDRVAVQTAAFSAQ